MYRLEIQYYIVFCLCVTVLPHYMKWNETLTRDVYITCILSSTEYAKKKWIINDNEWMNQSTVGQGIIFMSFESIQNALKNNFSIFQ